MAPKKSVYWLLLALDLLLAGGLVWGGWLYAGRSNELGRLNKERAALAAGQTTLARERAALEASAPERTKLGAYFISPDDLSLFIEALERAASSTDVTANLTAAKIEGKTDPAAHFTIEASGSYAQLFQYLRLLENLPFVLTLQQIQLDVGTPLPGKPTPWRAGLTLQLTSLLQTKNENPD